MTATLLRFTLVTTALVAVSHSAESTPPPAPAPAAPAVSAPPVTEAMIRARRAEHLKAKLPPKPAPAKDAPATLPAALAANPANAAAPAPADTKPDNPADLTKSKTEPAEVLPKVEVRRTRVTEIEREVFEQERDIAREKQKTKSSELDRALNDPKKSFSLFGGESTSQRENMAKERVSLMESERDILEAIAYAKTKAEKNELRKELDQIRALRRDLETAVR